MTNELMLAIDNYYKNLNENQQKNLVKKLCLDGINSSFLDDKIKKELIEYVEAIKI